MSVGYGLKVGKENQMLTKIIYQIECHIFEDCINTKINLKNGLNRSSSNRAI